VVSDLTLDYGRLMAEAVGAAGLTEADLEALSPAAALAHQEIQARRASGEMGFLDLPGTLEAEAARIREQADHFAAHFHNLVVLGIGGSALGTRALASALLKPYYNLRDRRDRGARPRLFVADNIDPDQFEGLLEICDPETTCFNVISKSGGTAETMSQFLAARQLLRDRLGEKGYRDRMIVTTDPKKGVLREIVDQERLLSFPVPANVGGRFSVLSAVGLFPAAMVGIDIQALLQGAAGMERRCREADWRRNPGYVLGALLYLAAVKMKRNLVVVMPYASSLLETAEWFQQLWAESLGKEKDRQGRVVHAGSTPVRALGVTDQHSQLQLYGEGPEDKVILFLNLEKFARTCPIPSAFADKESLAYLGGHSLSELIQAEALATEAALTRQGRPSLKLILPELSAEVMGQLILMAEAATVFAGGLWQINPLDQPGVEAGKQYTYGLMGRKGYEAKAKEIKEQFRVNPRYRI
jgi:glucose-6-phosphate isomerase